MTEIEFNALAAQGYNRIPVTLGNVCRPRYTAVDLPQTGQHAITPIS